MHKNREEEGIEDGGGEEGGVEEVSLGFECVIG